MKKILAVFTAAVIAMSSTAAFAAGRSAAISEALTDKSQIHIIYNDKVVEYEDVKPVNTDGRVMIPFRAALENMGASVDYNDSDRSVTAVKGDTTIHFTLMDDTIYVNKNGAESTVKMDVPMIIVSDRTLVPIRFMSDAFGMQIGWDGDTESVVILDKDDYFDSLAEIAPNMNKLFNMPVYDYNKEEASFDISANLGLGASNADLDMEGSLNGTYKEGTNAKIKLNITSPAKVDDGTVELTVKDEQIYVKTDVPAKMGKTSVDANTWYKLDMNKLVSSLQIDSGIKELLKFAVSGMKGNSYSAADVLEIGIPQSGDITLALIETLAAQFDTFEAIDKYIEVSASDTGSYKTSMKMNKDDFVSLMREIAGGDVSGYFSTLVFDVSANSEVSEKASSSDSKINIELTAEGVTAKLAFSMTDKCEADEGAAVVAAPEQAQDITDEIIKLISELL